MGKGNIHIGDKVRFLDSIGEGTVAKVEGHTVFVRTDDGFEMPMLSSDLVVISPANEANYQNSVPKEEVQPIKQEVKQAVDFEDVYETETGDALSLYIAFVPENIRQYASSDLDLYIVNDSNYFINFNLAQVKGDTLFSRYADIVAPNEKLYLDTIKAEQTNDFEELRVQGFAYKNKPYSFKPAIDVKLKIKPMSFCKLHSYKNTDFFEQQAILVSIIDKDVQEVDFQVPSNIVMQKEQLSHKQPARVKPSNEPLEVDLHIEQLVDNLSGFTPFDILSYQMAKFESVLKENLKFKGKKIVFIHGKGDGVLRAELLKCLKKKYPRCSSQDASFQKYGFGATMITIH